MGRVVSANVKDRALVRDRRDRIIRAAIAVFLRKGYHTATVRDIGREARLTQGTIYNYVRSKGDILYLVCDHLVTAYQDAVREAVDGIVDPSARLGEALRAVVEVMYARQEYILLLYHESHALDRKSVHAVLARVEEFIQLFERILSDAGANGHLAMDNRTLAANIVTFLPTIVALRRWDLSRKVPKEEIIRGLTDFMMRGLGARDGPSPYSGASGSSPSSSGAPVER
ncbi:MAG: TetR/AcrR family transcriptional regulator [Candidatus Rokubacteria bacterium]|nr:TetR/AcrR family transcriptional regulator [Candidatus Rokubacteria bacterium]